MISELFNWLSSPMINVSTKNYCLKTLIRLVKKYPDLRPELLAVVNDQTDKNTAAFGRQCKKAMAVLEAKH